MRSNRVLAQLFEETAKLLEFNGENYFRVRAFSEAAETMRHIEEDLSRIQDEKRLKDLPGIGDGMVRRINEFLEKGDFKDHEILIKKIPQGVLEVMNIPGVGPKKAKILYDKLGIGDIDTLKEMADTNKLQVLEGFGEKTELNIAGGIEKLKKFKDRILLIECDEISDEVSEKLKSIAGVRRVEVAGSLRRRKETVGDIDILYTSAKSGKKMGEEFTKGFAREDIIALGEKKTSCIWEKMCQVDLRRIEEKHWGAALQYFTGSVEHSLALRKYAIKKGLKINEYGVWNGKKCLASKTEKEFYEALNLHYIPPEMRENMGEIEAALHHSLPNLVDTQDIVGDIHVHSNYSDGANTIKEIAQKAESLGYLWVGISDHSKSLKIANGLDENKLKEKIKEISELNKRGQSPFSIKILAVQEVDIKRDGSLDYDDEVLKELDIVIAAIHTGFSGSEKEITRRIIAAMENPYVHIIAHPTGRLLNERQPYAVDMNEIINCAARTGTVLEINAHPLRLDTYYYLVKEAKLRGIKLAIGTDAHNVSGMDFMRYGLDVARRGWLEKSDLLNTMEVDELRKFLKG